MDRDEKILETFRRAAKNGQRELSIKELSLVTGNSYVSVWKRVEALKKTGDIIDGSTQKSKNFKANPQLL